jgi:carbonic anhydrase
VLAAQPDGSPAEWRRALEREGIKCSLDNLRTFPCIKQLEAKGRIALHGAYFDIAEGSLSVLDPTTEALVAL